MTPEKERSVKNEVKGKQIGKIYESPRLIVYGTLERITSAQMPRGLKDNNVFSG